MQHRDDPSGLPDEDDAPSAGAVGDGSGGGRGGGDRGGSGGGGSGGPVSSRRPGCFALQRHRGKRLDGDLACELRGSMRGRRGGGGAAGHRDRKGQQERRARRERRDDARPQPPASAAAPVAAVSPTAALRRHREEPCLLLPHAQEGDLRRDAPKVRGPAKDGSREPRGGGASRRPRSPKDAPDAAEGDGAVPGPAGHEPAAAGPGEGRDGRRVGAQSPGGAAGVGVPDDEGPVVAAGFW